jgi:hypothetical protein
MKVTIARLATDELWWFGGANAANYQESLTLAVEPSGLGNGFTFSLTAGTGIVDLSIEGQVTTLSSLSASTTENDVEIKVSEVGEELFSTKLTVLTPSHLKPNETFTQYSSGWTIIYASWHKLYQFDIYNQLDKPLTRCTENNESFGTVTDIDTSNNWGGFTAAGQTSATAGLLSDHWRVRGGHAALNPNVSEIGRSDALTEVQEVEHEYFVGSTNPGSGVSVRTHTASLRRGTVLLVVP